ncbi:MAG: hypothetical protein LBO65_07010 [Spirochaetaceae bacterium]|jgi:hypothetical protein|nr:hypothetical protein [Spirochaetaceae bacterium]
MVIKMLRRVPLVLLAPMVPVLFSCAGKKTAAAPAEERAEHPTPVLAGAAVPGNGGPGRGGNVDISQIPGALEELAEMERTGGYTPGLGLAESALREKTGDYAGAVMAVFKELSWAYSLGAGGVTREAIDEGLKRLADPEVLGQFPQEAWEEVKAAVEAIGDFCQGRWKEAEEGLQRLYGAAEADGFPRWMLLVCGIETSEGAGPENRSSYGAIRARYGFFPEYWYRGARNFPGAAAGDYAERCINLAPAGPYAAECRTILAQTMGLDSADASVLRTRLEIERVVSGAVERGDPELLADLLPLAGLPDNPSTLYASGAMRSLAADGTFRDWLSRKAEKAKGRLAERLLYISRG